MYRCLSDNYEPGDCIFLFGELSFHQLHRSTLIEEHQVFPVAHFKFASFRPWSTECKISNLLIIHLSVTLFGTGRSYIQGKRSANTIVCPKFPLHETFSRFSSRAYSAYELYSDSESEERNATQVGFNTEPTMSAAARFKNAFSYKDVKVHFVGAWYVFIISHL